MENLLSDCLPIFYMNQAVPVNKAVCVKKIGGC